MKPCYGNCDRCVWMHNGGCSEWNGFKEDDDGRTQTLSLLWRRAEALGSTVWSRTDTALLG